MKGRDLKLCFGFYRSVKRRFLPVRFNFNLAGAMLFFMILLSGFVFAANVGHNATVIGAGTFEADNYTFPDSLFVTNIFTVGTNVIYVDKTNGYVGIGTSTTNKTLTILGNMSLAGSEYISCTSLETDAEGGVRCGSDAGSSLDSIIGDISWWNESTDYGNLSGVPDFALNEELLYINDSTLNDTYYSILDNGSLDIRFLTLEHNASIITNSTGVSCLSISGADADFCNDANSGISFWAGSATNEIYNDTASGVGIGTNNPAYKIEVNSVDTAMNISSMFYVNETSIGINTPGSGGLLHISGNSDDLGNSDSVFLLLQDLDTTAGSHTAPIEWRDNNGNSLGKIYSSSTSGFDYLNGSGDFVFRIRPNGYVGLGSKVPSYGLEVNNDVNLSGLVYINSSKVGVGTIIPHEIFQIGDGGDTINNYLVLAASGNNEKGINFSRASPLVTDWSIKEDANEDLVIDGIRADDDLIIRTNDGGTSTTMFQIDASEPYALFPNGNVGIGTSSPAYKFEVNVDDVGSEEAINLSNVYINSSSVGIGTDVPGDEVHMLGSSGPMNVLIQSPESENVVINFKGDGTGTGYSIGRWDAGDQDNFGISRTGLDWPFVMDNGGQIGLGTSSPSYTFEINNESATAMNVSGMLYVNSTSVGIGTDVPGEALSVVGKGNFTGNITTSSDLAFEQGGYITDNESCVIVADILFACYE